LFIQRAEEALAFLKDPKSFADTYVTSFKEMKEFLELAAN